MSGDQEHRVRNIMHRVLAILHLSCRESEVEERFVERVEGRIHALAAAEALVARHRGKSVPFAELVAATVEPEAPVGAPRLSAKGDEVLVPPRSAPTLGLLLHELAGNAVLHGAWSGSGRVRVTWALESGGRELRIEWTEEDGPQVAPCPQGSFGRRFIENIAPQELAGEADLRFDSGGVRCLFRLPIEVAAQAREAESGSGSPLQ